MELPQKDNLVLDHRYFLGNFRDYSGNGNHGTPTGVNWEKRPDKHVRFVGTDLITVSDSAELQLTAGTIICYGDLDNYTSSDTMVSKRDAGGTNYQFYFNTSSNTALWDGADASNFATNWSGSKSQAVVFNSGKPKFYGDGVFKGDGNVTLTVTANDADITIGNLYTSGFPNTNPLKGVLIYNVELTDEEIVAAHTWIMAQFSPSYPKRNFTYPSRITGRESGLVGAWDMENVAQKIIDKTGSNVNGTIVNAVQCGLSGLNALCFNGSNAYVDLGDNFDIGTSDFTFSFLLKTNALGVAQCIIAKGATAANDEGYFLRITAGGTIQAYVSDGASYVLNNQLSTTALQAGKIYHVMWELDRSGNSTFYIDNVADATTADISGWVAEDINGTASATVGKIANIHYLNGSIGELRIYNKVLSTAEKAELYNKYAQLPYFIDDLRDANESPAAEGGTTGAYLSNTDYRFGDTAGRFKISVEEVNGNPHQHVIECTTAGQLYIPVDWAYGTFSVWLKNKSGVASRISFSNTATTVGATGYELNISAGNVITLIRPTIATIITAGTAATSDVWEKYDVTRRYDGLFELFLNGSSEGTGINNTLTSGGYCVLDLDAGDKVTLPEFYNGVLTP